jgi:hypothetical protein
LWAQAALIRKQKHNTKMKNRYKKAIAGRVNPDIRNKVQPLIEKFAQENQLPFNTVFGAAMFAAERLKGRVTCARVEALVTAATVHAYELEMQRRTTARKVQITGIIRRALPVAKRTTEVIEKLYSQFCGFQGSIPALMQQVQAAAATA